MTRVRSRWSVSPLLAAVLALGLTGGCADDEATAPVPVPQLEADPLEEGDGPARGPQDASGPVATWTPAARFALPDATPPASGQRRAGPPVSAPARGTPAAPAGLPQPTTAPTQPVAAQGPPATDPDIVARLEDVRPGRLTDDVEQLAAFGTRHALSAADDPRTGRGAARDWLTAELEAIAAEAATQVQVEQEPFSLELAGTTSTQHNVIATLTGLGQPKRLVYVTAHYDSRTEDVTDGVSPAPGADDNASGTAVLLELARVLSDRGWDASLRLVAFAAEEPGLKGSRHHAPLAAEAGLPILAVLNNDIVGGVTDPDGRSDPDHVRVFSGGPDDGGSRRLSRYVSWIAERYGLLEPVLVPAEDRPNRGGDHQPFHAAGFPAVRLISALEDTSRQHNDQDTPERIEPDYLAAVTRLDLAAVTNLALAPPAPVAAPQLAVSDGRPDALRVRWEPVAHPDVAGYWVAWRGTETHRGYDGLRWAGQATELELTDLPPPPLAVTVATSDDRGHASLFGPEAQR